jgi:polysaccharide export outer membrane protein
MPPSWLHDLASGQAHRGRRGPRGARSNEMNDQLESTEVGAGAPRARAASARPGRTRRLHLLLLAGVLAACATPEKFVRVEDLPEGPGGSGAGGLGDEEYRLAAGDVVSVRVWNQDAMSVTRIRLRDDGKISVPFLQDVEAVNRTPAELSTMLRAKLMAFVVNPVVTVSLEEVRPLRVPVTGEVLRPGIYDLDRRVGVLTALAAAGGFSDFAHRDAIYVLRYQLPIGERVPLRIRFTYRSLVEGTRPAATFRLRDGDVVVVE